MSFQKAIRRLLTHIFNKEIASDPVEREHRFYEEATELVQAGTMTRQQCHDMVDFVFDRPVGERFQEVGGVMFTLGALCNAYEIDMKEAGWVGLGEGWTKVEKIRAKRAQKPAVGPLPVGEATQFRDADFINRVAREPGSHL